MTTHPEPFDAFPAVPSAYSVVDDLIVTEPLVVSADRAVADVARDMTRCDLPCAIVHTPDGRYGLITDGILRRSVIAEGRPGTTRVAELMVHDAPTTVLGRSAAEALIDLLDSPTEFVIVTDESGRARGVVAARDFVVSPTTAGVSTHEQIRRAADLEELVERSRKVPATLAGALDGGLAASRVIAVYSAIVDTIVRRAITLVFERHPELSTDWFTWLSLGSNGRREAVPSSDVDAAVAFDNARSRSDIARCRQAFVEVNDVLQRCGLSVDGHGAVAEREAFSRTNRQWRAAAQQWIAAPTENHGVIMTSLLVDGRPIHGDPGLPEVNRVFTELRRHPGTMRLLLEESLSHRARLRSMRAVLTGRGDRFDVKNRALLPIVNIARWSALATGSTELHTPQRLRSAAGSRFLPNDHAQRLVEVFETLQDLRLRHQLQLLDEGRAPTDILERDRLSPIDRGIVAESVREIATIQRRMESVASYTPPAEWGSASERG
ncbi:putative nucleotidyltransferase substrate binding domain-containing protein [Gordonia sp. CPCC 205515]|uniref:putative nucleotidyltransferase substrate binding domain-containing protein n=1 Tax=Gordonia sp. CPCC 205515 TaxID=3140791 RepID=UPI003AF33EA0